jgi:hypothetical protein
VTCLLTAATAALQVLAYLDGTGTPAALDATIELRPPDHAPRLRRWTAHPACGCGAAGAPQPTRRPPGRGTSRGHLRAEWGSGRQQWAAERAHQLTGDDTTALQRGPSADEEDA